MKIYKRYVPCFVTRFEPYNRYKKMTYINPDGPKMSCINKGNVNIRIVIFIFN